MLLPLLLPQANTRAEARQVFLDVNPASGVAFRRAAIIGDARGSAVPRADAGLRRRGGVGRSGRGAQKRGGGVA